MPEQKEPRSVRRMLMSWKKKISLLRKGSSSKALSPASDTSSPVGDTASEETAVADKSDKLTAMRKARSEGTAHRDIGAAPAHATINSSQSFASASMSTIRSGIGAYERKKVAATGFEGGGLKKLYHNKSTPSLQQQQQQHKSQTMRATTYRQSVLMSQIFTSDQHQQQARAKLHTPQRQSSQPSQQQQQQQHRHQLNSATSSRRRSSTHTTSIYGLGAAAKSESSLAYQKRLSRLNSGMLVPQSGVQLGSAPYLPNYYQAQYSMQGPYQMPPFV
ncbi:hypothetical protein EV182_001840 [Spiromyces aspiralis]|uniref:Uncharacterized protein n=1 Tax=Spiromyces aspiralis TaxID=68401 RepID=A0ACC1HIL4_9FUNG|nr:hypothetical protein EV182_001840 [Spiromyces aspiralis]